MAKYLDRKDCVDCAEIKMRLWSDGLETQELWCPYFKEYLTNCSDGSVSVWDLDRLPDCISDVNKSREQKSLKEKL